MIWLFANESYGAPFIEVAASFAAATGTRIRLVVSARPAPGDRKAPPGMFRRARLAIALRRRHGLPARAVADVNARRFADRIARDDDGIVAGFNQIFRPATIAAFRSLVNFHPSLLPYYRGPIPSHWCLQNGETASGYTLHRVTGEIDRGEILHQEVVPIPAGATAGSLDLRIAERGAAALSGYLRHLTLGEVFEGRTVDAAAAYRHHPAYLSFDRGS